MPLEEEFWEWFLENEEMLLAVDNDSAYREEVFDALHSRLLQMDENLTFELGPREPKRELILSAGGISESFPAVLRLKKAAPVLDRWELILFRPRRWPSGIIELGPHRVDSNEIYFTLLTREREIGIQLFIPGYNDNQEFKQIAYLFLDEALGEFDVETKVRFLKFLPTDEPEEFARSPFRELPATFDHLYMELNGLSGKPS